MPTTTYKQIQTVASENDFGPVTRLFIISDNHAELFNNSAGTVANIFKISDIDKKKENDIGKYVENELTFSIDEAACNTIPELAALAFTLTAFNTNITLFCALFDGTNRTPENAIFTGLIQSDRDNDDSLWTKTQYAENRKLKTVWKITAKPYFENTFDSIELKDLVYGTAEGVTPAVPGIDSTWETANVADRPGWYKKETPVLKEIRVRKLVSLNAVLRILADNLQTALFNKGLGAITILYDACTIAGEFQPARWKTRWYPSDPVRYVQLPSGLSKSYYLYDDDGVNLKIDPDAEVQDDYSTIWINYSLLKYNDKWDFLPESAKPFSWTECYKKFTDLLIGIAQAFDLFLDFYYTDSDELHIRFVGRSAYSGTQTYIKDAVKSSLKLSVSTPESDNYCITNANYLAIEGNDCYENTGIINGSNLTLNPSKKYGVKPEKNPLPLTIAPTVCKMVSAWDITGIGRENVNDAGLPHNHYHYPDILPTNDYLSNLPRTVKSAIAIHRAVYMYVDKRTGETIAPDHYWTQAAALNINVDGVDEVFESLSDYRNRMSGRDVEYFEAEKTIDLPGWNGFSLSSDGSSPSWKNIELGSIIVLDGLRYTVTGIKIDGQVPKTSLTLHASGRFEDITEPGGLVEHTPDDPEETETAPTNILITSEEDLIKGNVVILDADGYAVKAKSTADYRKLYGVVTEDAVAGEELFVERFPCKIKNSAWSFAIGTKIYLRYTGLEEPPIDYNISDQPLTEATADEDLYARVGLTEAPDTIAFNVDLKFIHQPVPVA